MPDSTPEAFRSCGQIGAAPGEDRLAVEKQAFWDNRTEIVLNIWGQVSSLLYSASSPTEGTDFNVGTVCKTVAQDQPTMNYGWFDDTTSDEQFSRVVIHEFGHAIGCTHEQSSPVANIPWKKEVVYEAYEKNDGWTREMVHSQVFAVAEQETVVNSSNIPTMQHGPSTAPPLAGNNDGREPDEWLEVTNGELKW
ncbi:hypothetical protein LZ554_001203 [Drepanopeziza brunnea f. sp. 'monogermtubi']|nr:hypothetical protein LZ554_001203 [Drepanopeziza brunnea f. sp. 'monogermtubi']